MRFWTGLWAHWTGSEVFLTFCVFSKVWVFSGFWCCRSLGAWTGSEVLCCLGKLWQVVWKLTQFWIGLGAHWTDSEGFLCFGKFWTSVRNATVTHSAQSSQSCLLICNHSNCDLEKLLVSPALGRRLNKLVFTLFRVVTDTTRPEQLFSTLTQVFENCVCFLVYGSVYARGRST